MSDIQSVVGEDVNFAAEVEQQAEQPQEQEPEQSQAPEAQQEPAEPKVVPLAALHEERQRRRELQQSLQAERQAREEMERRVQARLEQLTAALTPKPEVPSFDENPAAALKHELGEVKQLVQQTQQQKEAEAAQARAREQIQVAAQRVQAVESEFAAQKPDYYDAIAFFKESRARELEAFGLDIEVARQQAGREMTEGALMHAANGRNPAEMTYRFAMARGYTPKQVANATNADKMALQQKGVAAAKTLGSGGAATGKISVEALVNMSDEEFAEATKGGKWAQLMGGRSR